MTSFEEGYFRRTRGLLIMAPVITKLVSRKITWDEFLGPNCHCLGRVQASIEVTIDRTTPLFLEYCKILQKKPEVIRDWVLRFRLDIFKREWKLCQCTITRELKINLNIRYPLSKKEQEDYQRLCRQDWLYKDFEYADITPAFVSRDRIKYFPFTKEEVQRRLGYEGRLQEYFEKKEGVIEKVVREFTTK